MADLYDAVQPDNLPAFLKGAPALRITVLANPEGQAFDSETGNAGVDAVAQAVNVRHSQGRWSVGYTNEDNFAPLTTALAARGLEWSSAEHWPAPGVYLWCAAPGCPNGQKPAWATVTPVAIQNRYPGPFDVSYVGPEFPVRVAGYIDGPVSEWPAAAWAKYTTVDDTPAAPPVKPVEPAQPPAEPTVEVCAVQLPILAQGAQGAAVRAVQTLVGGVAVDGVFGPVTHAAVVGYQAGHGLAADGVVGQHTWGSLLGAPQ